MSRQFEEDETPPKTEGYEVRLEKGTGKIAFIFPTIASWRQVAERNVRPLFTDDEMRRIKKVAMFVEDPYFDGSVPFAPEADDAELYDYYEDFVGWECEHLHTEHVLRVFHEHGAST